MRPSVAICICTRDRPDSLAVTLESIARSSHPVDHVVVSDDGEDTATVDVCRDARIRVQHVRGPRAGLGPNRNHAFAQTSQDRVLFLDDDCLLGPDFLTLTIDCLAALGQRGTSSQTIVSGSEKTPSQARKLPAAQTFLGFQARPYEAGEPLTSININCTLFPRGMFERHVFDPLIRYGYDEVDIASRAVKDGYVIVLCPDAVNDHRPSAESREDYARFKTASRLYVTFKRYVLTEGRFGYASVYVAAAPAHACVSGFRHKGMRGVGEALKATWLAATLFRAHINDQPRRRAGILLAMLTRAKAAPGAFLLGCAERMPQAVITRLQDVVAKNLWARAIVRRLSWSARHGAHRIAAGPARGLMIDVAGSRPSYILGQTEKDMQEFFQASVRSGDVVMDLGANVGFFTLVAAALTGPSGKVVAYEPSPTTVRAVRRNVQLNGLDYVTVVQAAVSAQAGVAHLDLGVSDQNASIVRRDGGTTVEVPTVSVDDEVRRLNITPTFIKIDVEGAEADVIAGMRETLQRDKPLIVCEVHDAKEGLRGPIPVALRAAGYAVSWLDGTGEDWPPHLVARP